MSQPIRVLIVDDSAFARKVLRELLTQVPGVEVVGAARDGLEALEKISELKPDVVTLDLVMPELDGLGVLDGLPSGDRPRVLVVSTSDGESELAISALQRGAFDLVSKPTALATDRLYELRDDLVRKVLAAAGARGRELHGAISRIASARQTSARELVVIGASTGGPHALTRLISSLPADFPLPIAIALHIPHGYTKALSERMDSLSALEVLEAYEGIELRPGRVVIARGGEHLKLRRDASALLGTLSLQPTNTAHFPSVNVLFESAAEVCGKGAFGVVLTGMGDDGTRGAGAIRARGGMVLTEAESSCVVYGMPRAVREAGHSDGEAPLDELPRLMLSRL